MTSVSLFSQGPVRSGVRLSAVGLAVASLASVTTPLASAQIQATLAPVVVTATRVAQPLTDVLADVSLLDRTAIERSGAVNVAEVLSQLPGVEFSRTGGPAGVTSLYLRGGETRHTLLLIDGVRVDSQATGGATWSMVPLAQVERIEVLRGPAAAIYGSDALGGVVQIITRKGEGPVQPSVAVGVGSHGTLALNASVSGSSGDWDYSLGLGRELSNGFNAMPLVNADLDGYRRTTGSGRVGFKINREHRVEATWLGNEGQSAYDNAFDAGTDYRALQKLSTVGLAWVADWSPVWRSRVALTQGHEHYDSPQIPYVTDTTVTTALLHNEWHLGVHQLTADLERREDKLNNASTTPANTLRSQNALALGYGAKLGAHTVQLNLRHDVDSEFGSHDTGSAGYAFALTPAWRLTASAGTAFRAPTLYQRFSIYGVPTLRPESSVNREIGVKYAAQGSQFGLVAYRNRVADLITYVSGPGACANGVGAFAGCYGNTGKASFTGVTLSGGTRVGQVALTSSLDFSNPRDEVSGKQLARRAKRVFKLGADTQVAGWGVSGELLLSGQRFNNASNTQRLPGYGVLNLSVTKALQPGLDLLVRLDNVTNTAYQTVSGYATGGRMAYVGLKWTGR